MSEASLLARRLANFRTVRAETNETERLFATHGRARSRDLAQRLADAVDGQAVETPLGTVVRVDGPARPMPIDRESLARLPGQPPSHVPLVCLDTETTGLATAAGTVAFLVGLGWWEGQRFRQVQLLLPDHSEEAALLELLGSLIPTDCWLVTYNGRTFDWPLLVARYRMTRRDAPSHAGHLDLLTTVRRLFRHRLPDARLRTAEEGLLGMGRMEDVEGWEIPGRYLAFLRGGNPVGLVPVLEHNDHDVRSLARLLAHVADELGDETRRAHAPDGDLLGLARSFRREGRLNEAMACLDAASTRPSRRIQRPARRTIPTSWLVDRSDGIASAIAELSAARAARVVRDQIARERARLLRQVGRLSEAREAWQDLAGRNGPLAAIAWVELAKVLEHVDRNFAAALEAVAAAEQLAGHSATIGRPLPLLEVDLMRRRRRLERRIRTAGGSARTVTDAASRRPAAAPGLLHASANG